MSFGATPRFITSSAPARTAPPETVLWRRKRLGPVSHGDPIFERISASRAEGERITAFAGGTRVLKGSGALSYAPHSILSIARHALLPFFDTRGARALRLVCAEFRDAVAAHPWHDAETRIRSRFGAWRASFPFARAANVSGARRDPADLTDADFVHFAGLRDLPARHCCSLRAPQGH